MQMIDSFMVDNIRVLEDRIRTLTMNICFYSKEENKAEISKEAFALMKKQLTAMRSYSLILKKRVAISCNEKFSSSAELNKFINKLFANRPVVDLSAMTVVEFEKIANDMALAAKADREVLISEVLQLSEVANKLQFNTELTAMASDRIRAILQKL